MPAVKTGRVRMSTGRAKPCARERQDDFVSILTRHLPPSDRALIVSVLEWQRFDLSELPPTACRRATIARIEAVQARIRPLLKD